MKVNEDQDLQKALLEKADEYLEGLDDSPRNKVFREFLSKDDFLLILLTNRILSHLHTELDSLLNEVNLRFRKYLEDHLKEFPDKKHNII